MIDLPGGYAMDADDYCYIIGKPYKNPKDGKVILQKKTYYAKLEDACTSVAGHCTRDAIAGGEIADLHSLCQYISQINAEINSLIEGGTVTKLTSDVSAGDSKGES